MLGIDAANIRAGGGRNHLIELIRAAVPSVHGFSKVIVWGGRGTLDAIEDRPWLVKVNPRALDKGLIQRTLWQCFRLSVVAREAGCHLLYVPGGSNVGTFRPFVACSQNLLPFEWQELKRYGFSLLTLKFAALRVVQGTTFRRADGLVFLTEFARETVLRKIGVRGGQTVVIHHGVGEEFRRRPRAKQRSLNDCSVEQPFRFLYVSIIDVYKHQVEVAAAVSRLRANGAPVVLDLVGPAYTPELERLRATLRMIDPKGETVRYVGPIAHQELPALYQNADAFIFASSCEAFALILLEAMASGLPIAASRQGSHMEVLGNAGLYFNPEDSSEIDRVLHAMLSLPSGRERDAQSAFERAGQFSWTRCADETFAFMSTIARESETHEPAAE